MEVPHSEAKPRERQLWLWRGIALSGLALLVVMALLHLLQPAWRDVYFYNGDSLTLALLMKSLVEGEPFRWVLSSQLFLFPEALIYALCSAVTTSVRSALLVNSAVALLLLYVGYGLLGRVVLEARDAARAFALLATSLLVLCVLCEVEPRINRQAFATLYLFSTYYYGVVLSGLLVLFWIAQALERERNYPQVSPGIAGPLLGIFVVTGLTYFSDPLFFLQCSAPALAALCLMYLGRLVSRRTFVWLVVVQVAGLASGSVGRSLCKAYIGNPVAKYFDFRNVAQSLKFLEGMFGGLWRMPAALLEYGLLVLGVIAAMAAIWLGWRQWCHERMSKTKSLRSVDMLVALFALGSPMSSIAGALLTGNPWTRYWLPLAVFPVLALLPLGRRFGCRSYRGLLVVAVLCIATGSAFYGPMLYEHGVPRPSGPMSAGVQCYNRIMSQKPFNTVGGFWMTRALDLYSITGSRSLQVSSDLHVWARMNNRAPYSVLEFNGIVVDRLGKGGRLPNRIYASDVARLGPYSKKFSCPSFDIYYYDTGSSGYIKLNQALGL